MRVNLPPEPMVKGFWHVLVAPLCAFRKWNNWKTKHASHDVAEYYFDHTTSIFTNINGLYWIGSCWIALDWFGVASDCVIQDRSHINCTKSIQHATQGSQCHTGLPVESMKVRTMLYYLQGCLKNFDIYHFVETHQQGYGADKPQL